MLIVIIAISLSMDAFSLALAYGMYNFSNKETIILATVVGLYHLIMPFLGYNFGNVMLSLIHIKPSIIVFIIFSFIGLEMIIDIFKEDNKKKIKGIIEMLGFGLAVSIDSFSTGIGIKIITNKLFLAFLTFSIVSFSFTYFGLVIGSYINGKVGKMANLIGGITLIVLGISYIFK